MKKNNEFGFNMVHQNDNKIRYLYAQLQELWCEKNEQQNAYINGVRNFMVLHTSKEHPLTAAQIEMMSHGAINKQSIVSMATWAEKGRMTDKALTGIDYDSDEFKKVRNKLSDSATLCEYPAILELHKVYTTVKRRICELDDNGNIIPDTIQIVEETVTAYYYEEG